MVQSQARETGNIGPEAEVAVWRLYALRALYLVIGLFLITGVGPQLANLPPTLMTGVARALLTALGLLALLGVRYPLQMLPLMLFEGAWKAIWLAAIGLPLWTAGRLGPDSAGTFRDCAIGLPLVLVVLPWKYLFEYYVRRPSERWR